jgi:hypothetical protein
VALLLRAKGIIRVRSLEGRIDAWLTDNFPFVTESLVEKPVVLERRYFSQLTVSPKIRNAKVPVRCNSLKLNNRFAGRRIGVGNSGS